MKRRLAGILAAGTMVLAAGCASVTTAHVPSRVTVTAAPRVTAHPVAAPGVPQRPSWDGYGNPPAPTGTMMLCPARDAGNGALLADGSEVECVADGYGPHGPVFAWEAMR